MSNADFANRSIAELGTDLRAGKITAGAIAEEVIAAQDAREPALHAYRDRNNANTRAQAAAADAAFAAKYELGVLQGLPVSAKDLYAVAGYDTYAGTAHALPMFKQEGPVVRAVRSQMAVITGKLPNGSRKAVPNASDSAIWREIDAKPPPERRA